VTGSSSGKPGYLAGQPRWVFRHDDPGVVGVAYSQGHEEPMNAPKVGECAKTDGAKHVLKVPCADSAATMVVTSRVDGTADGQSACASDYKATSFYSVEATTHEVSVTSFVLCLADR
jgi:hypothetical protein